MPKHRFLERASPAVVKEACVTVDHFRESDSPQGRRAPLAAGCQKVGPPVCQRRPHVMQQQISERVNGLMGKLRYIWVLPGVQGRCVAGSAADVREQPCTFLDRRTLNITSCGDCQHSSVEGELFEEVFLQ